MIPRRLVIDAMVAHASINGFAFEVIGEFS